MVWKLDRPGRSLRHLIETVTGRSERGVGFLCLQEAIDKFAVSGTGNPGNQGGLRPFSDNF